MADGSKRDDIVKCPVCRKEKAWRDNPYRPFCSERCRLIDLGTWASEGYRIEGDQRPADHDEEDRKK